MTSSQPIRDADGVPLMVTGRRNPTGTGRYCAPKRCYCGRCPGWAPRPPVNYAAALRSLAEAERGRPSRRRSGGRR